jgi:diphthamide synthase (EF-2-diphthine--ammonia ligase)
MTPLWQDSSAQSVQTLLYSGIELSIVELESSMLGVKSDRGRNISYRLFGNFGVFFLRVGDFVYGATRTCPMVIL